MSASTSDRARELLATGNVACAIGLVTDAADRGDGAALFELAVWHVLGHPLPRDFRKARGLLGAAAETGYGPAALMHAVFVALGAGGSSNWQKAMHLLAKAAHRDPEAALQKALIDGMKIDLNGMPEGKPMTDTVSISPKVSIIRRFLTPAECSHLIMLSKPLLVPSVVVDPETGRETAHPVRTSDGTVLGPIQMDLVVEAINRRIAAATRTCVEQGEPLAVLRYKPGQQYRLHHDCLPGEVNQRSMTFIVFLNEEFDGGATHFPALDAAIRGSTGDAILFNNVLEDGRVDQASRHAGLPVVSGEKWICTRWIRSGSFDPWGMRCV